MEWRRRRIRWEKYEKCEWKRENEKSFMLNLFLFR
jgi:hypothetical protein